MSLIKAFNWKIEDIGALSWGQIACLETTLGELDDEKPSVKPTEKVVADAEFEELSQNVEYQNGIAEMILSSKKADGTLDMTRLMTLLRPPGSGKK